MTKVDKKKKTVRTAVRIALIAIVALIVGLNVYEINASRLAGDVLPMPFGVGGAVVLSGSMEPALSVGDLLIVVKSDDYRLRDIIVYQDGSTAVTHRIVEMLDEQIVTRGDANNIEDEPIGYEQVKGKVVFAVPLVGYLVNVIKTPVGTLLILGLAIFLMERSFRTEKERDRQEMEQIRAEIEKLRQEQNGEH